MRKFKVIWYSGPFCEIPDKNHIINEDIIEAKDINFDNFIEILSGAERFLFRVEIEYCVRCLYWSEYQWFFDYGCHSRFIYVEELKDENV